MKKILAALMLCAACETAFAQTAEELLADGKNTENVTTFGMGYDLKMYSPLKQINKSNVKRLVPVWTFSLANDMGELSQPTIYNGVMYVVNGNWTFAIDVATGRQIWRTPVNYDRAALRVADRRRDHARAGDDLQRQALSADARRARRGARHEDRQGDLETKIRRIQGRLQGRYRSDHRQRRTGIRHGRRRQHDARLHRRLRSGYRASGYGGPGRYPRRASPVRRRGQTRPSPTRGNTAAARLGRCFVRSAARPDLYRHGQRRAVQPIVSRRHGQPVHREHPRDPAEDRRAGLVLPVVPNDSFDFDANAESVLADMHVHGQMRKVLINAHKNGFLYVLDRTNGKLIAANPFVKVNWATHIDLETGRPVLTDILDRAVKGETVTVIPSRGTNATLIAFNPKTGLVYLNSWNLPRS